MQFRNGFRNIVGEGKFRVIFEKRQDEPPSSPAVACCKYLKAASGRYSFGALTFQEKQKFC